MAVTKPNAAYIPEASCFPAGFIGVMLGDRQAK